MTSIRKFLFALAYLCFTGAGFAGLFTDSLLVPLITPSLVRVYSIFLIVGGITAALGIYTRIQWELVGLPLLGSGHTMYAAALAMYAAQTGRGWLTALIVSGIVVNILRRWVTAWQFRNEAPSNSLTERRG